MYLSFSEMVSAGNLSSLIFLLLASLGMSTTGLTAQALRPKFGEHLRFYSTRNVSFISFVVRFLPPDLAAFSVDSYSNHILCLALSLFLLVRLALFVVQLPRTFKSESIQSELSPALITDQLPET